VHPRVIVAYDGSPRSLTARPVAEAAADAFGSELVLVHVVDDDEDPPEVDVPDLRIVEAADPAAGLIDEVRASSPAALLCLSTHGRGPVGELVFGSIAGQVLRRLQEPVLVIGPGLAPAPHRTWSRMLVCLDGSPTSGAIVPIARAWALELGLQLHLLHIAYPLGNRQAGDGRAPEEERAAIEQLIVVADSLRGEGIDVGWEVEEHTDTASGIVEELQRGLFDLVALASHGRTGLARLLAGSVTTDVVRRSPAPVLLLRPEQLG
jgi:nucleotide-binding universal stress UspA family protein